MQTYSGRTEPTRFQDLTVTVDFHCHSACQFCIVQEGMNYFKGVPFEKFKEAVDDNGSSPRYRRCTFTGGEITLEKQLFRYLDYAREHGGFEHIRLQTNGRLLANMEYARRLVEAGVDEFFVSLHGATPELQDRTAQRPGSFAEAWQGLLNLKELGVVIMTNTVLTTLNADTLSDIVELVAPLRPARMEFWNYLTMEDFDDTRGLTIPMNVLGPALRSALDRADVHGVPCAVKYVPQCLMGTHGDKLDNTQPDVVIVEEFYEIYPEFSCLWEAKCEHSETCLGLTHDYVRKYGWEGSLLKPVPRTRPWAERHEGPAINSDDPTSDGDAPATHHPEWLALVAGVEENKSASLESLLLDRRHCTFRFVTPGGSRVDLQLTRRNMDRDALLRSKSFNIGYRNMDLVAGDADAKAALTEIVKAATRAVCANDVGEMKLDERKGLVGAEAFRRKKALEARK